MMDLMRWRSWALQDEWICLKAKGRFLRFGSAPRLLLWLRCESCVRWKSFLPSFTVDWTSWTSCCMLLSAWWSWLRRPWTTGWRDVAEDVVDATDDASSIGGFGGLSFRRSRFAVCSKRLTPS